MGPQTPTVKPTRQTLTTPVLRDSLTVRFFADQATSSEAEADPPVEPDTTTLEATATTTATEDTTTARNTTTTKTHDHFPFFWAFHD